MGLPEVPRRGTRTYARSRRTEQPSNRRWTIIASAAVCALALVGVSPAWAEEPAPPSPHLRWEVTDASGSRLPGTSFAVAGPGAGAADDAAAWSGAAESTVPDNTGQPGYSGADLDPAPGAFLVERLDAGGAAVHAVTDDDRFRIRATEVPEGLEAGTAWTALRATTGDAGEAQRVTLAEASESPAASETAEPTETEEPAATETPTETEEPTETGPEEPTETEAPTEANEPEGAAGAPTATQRGSTTKNGLSAPTAAAPTNCGTAWPAGTPGGFEIDGNICQNDTTTSDWGSVGGQPIADDLYAASDLTQFSSGEKETTWPWTSYSSAGSPNDKVDVGKVYGLTRTVGSRVYTYLGFERATTTGSVSYHVELNQKQNSPANSPVTVRTVGDLRLTLEQTGSSGIALLGAEKWTGSAWAALGSLNGFVGKVNQGNITNLAGQTLAAGQFAEVSIDLTALFGQAGCSGTYGVLNVRSSSSPEDTSTLKDWVQPIQLSVPSTCALVCGTGSLYSVASGGAVRQISDGAVSSFGSWSGVGVSDVNALAIGANGDVAYAIDRSGFTAGNVSKVLRYDPVTGAWSAIPSSSYSTGLGGSLVAGAVNLSNGMYLFGGFNGDASRFYLYQYNPTTNTFSQKGWISTPFNAGNGDMAFDANGNLYVVASATSTTIYTITAANLAAASGSSEISRSRTEPKTISGLSGVNGIAFDTDGSIFLGNSTTVKRFNPTTFEDLGTITTGLSDSTDLASCNSPANLTVRKNVIDRVNAGDQFKLELKSGSTVVSTATTTGSAKGVQSQQIGPVPVIAGQQYTISESMASGTAADYASSWSCTNGASGSGTSGTVTIPNTSGASVVCTFTNTPLVAQVTVSKTVRDVDGANPQPGVGWQLGDTATPTTGTVTATPAAVQQTTSASGAVNWTLKFGTPGSRATLHPSETQQAGYQFVSGSCTVTAVDGTTRVVVQTGAAGTDVPNVAPGEKVACSFVNQLKPTELTLVKRVVNDFAGTSVVSDWTLQAAGPTPISGKTDAAAVTDARVEPGTYTLSESGGPAGYSASAWVCTNGGQPLALNGDQVSLQRGDDVVCTITNSDKPGAVAWSKVEQGTHERLAGSEWKVEGPTSIANLVDCTSAPCPAGAGTDQDPDPGEFALEGLKWGDYTVTETLAPPGYTGGASFTFTVSGSNAGTVIAKGEIENTPVIPPELPLTGGLGRDFYLIAGAGVLVAAAAAYAALRIRMRRRAA